MKNKYKLSEELEINYIVKEFDEQIVIELEENFDNLDKCPSHWSKLLFLETIDFNFYNWKIIQTDEYLLNKKMYQGAEKYKFMYEAVLEHKKRLVNVNGEMYYDIS